MDLMSLSGETALHIVCKDTLAATKNVDIETGKKRNGEVYIDNKVAYRINAKYTFVGSNSSQGLIKEIILQGKVEDIEGFYTAVCIDKVQLWF